MLRIKSVLVLLLMKCCFYVGFVRGEVVVDLFGTGSHIETIDDFETRDQAFARCEVFRKALGYVVDGQGYCHSSYVSPLIEAGWLLDSGNVFHLGIFWFGKCTKPSVFNVSTGECGSDEQKGFPSIEDCVGNPINIAIGNKFQSEIDYQSFSTGAPYFERFYNGFDGLWRHSYSAFIRFAVGKLAVVHSDGKESFFNVLGDNTKAYSTDLGTLTKSGDQWVYMSADNQYLIFDGKGRLIERTDPAGLKMHLIYNGSIVRVVGGDGQALEFTEDSQHQPLSFAVGGISIKYEYDSNKHLVQLTRTYGARTERRQFHYEDSRDTGLLTGITDERGIRFATWAYDEKGRAISSQHSGGAGLTQVAYNADGSSTVTNELGKTTVYQYQQIGGIKRVTSIKGEPSANCPASNSSYTYNDRGLVLTKTDAKGLITTYSYNDRGLEISRTEATGTTLARTTTTEWDPNRFLPIKVIEPNRITVYSYDNQGRELTRQSTSR